MYYQKRYPFLEYEATPMDPMASLKARTLSLLDDDRYLRHENVQYILATNEYSFDLNHGCKTEKPCIIGSSSAIFVYESITCVDNLTMLSAGALLPRF